MSQKKLVFTVIETTPNFGGRKSKDIRQTFDGIGNYKGKTDHCIIATGFGETELWEWDGTELGVEELQRYYRAMYGSEATLTKYTKTK